MLCSWFALLPLALFPTVFCSLLFGGYDLPFGLCGVALLLGLLAFSAFCTSCSRSFSLLGDVGLGGFVVCVAALLPMLAALLLTSGFAWRFLVVAPVAVLVAFALWCLGLGE